MTSTENCSKDSRKNIVQMHYLETNIGKGFLYLINLHVKKYTETVN